MLPRPREAPEFSRETSKCVRDLAIRSRLSSRDALSIDFQTTVRDRHLLHDFGNRAPNTLG